MTRSFALAAVLALTSLLPAADPADKIPELKALAHYVGEWDTVTTSKDPPFAKGTSSTKWVLDGRYIQQEWAAQDKDGKTVATGTMLATYDTDKKAYRLWTFMSDGSAAEATGTWDAKTKVLTCTTAKDANGLTTKTVADFSADGAQTWAITVTDGTGKVVFELAGKNTRLKK